MTYKPKQLGVLTVSAALLRQVLMLPDGTEIRMIRQSQQFRDCEPDMECVISGPHLPTVEDGAKIPGVEATYKRDNSGVHFVGYSWNAQQSGTLLGIPIVESGDFDKQLKASEITVGMARFRED